MKHPVTRGIALGNSLDFNHGIRHQTLLLVTQRFNGVEATGAPGRI